MQIPAIDQSKFVRAGAEPMTTNSGLDRFKVVGRTGESITPTDSSLPTSSIEHGVEAIITSYFLADFRLRRKLQTAKDRHKFGEGDD